ncbi:Hypothetical predicted protein [Lecanosticta acicola]|uniref:Uncharacterized protein n=1 Tax=Lecanosticta acicola TaxID=111012 RepID=A0AAI9EAX1_9PEZI|nr:Hypothetical predicted protein [Lecanosticta acicola]
MSRCTSRSTDGRTKITVDSLIHSDHRSTPPMEQDHRKPAQYPITRRLPPLEELFASDLLITNQVGRYRTSDHAKHQGTTEGRQAVDHSLSPSRSSARIDPPAVRSQLLNERRTADSYARDGPAHSDLSSVSTDLRQAGTYQHSAADQCSVASHSLPSTPSVGYSSWTSLNGDFPSDKEHHAVKDQRSDSVFTDSFNMARTSNRSSPVYMMAAPDLADADLRPATYVYQPYPTDYQGIQIISGKGPCHVYTSGYFVPTHVEGKYVDPSRGLTRSKGTEQEKNKAMTGNGNERGKILLQAKSRSSKLMMISRIMLWDFRSHGVVSYH